ICLFRGAPPPRNAVGPHPHGLPAPRFARRRWLLTLSRLDQHSVVTHSNVLLIQAARCCKTAARAKRALAAGWGGAPTPRRGGGAPQRKPIMLIQSCTQPHSRTPNRPHTTSIQPPAKPH